MDIKKKTEIVKFHSLFENLTGKEIESLTKKAKEKIFPPKTIILDQSEPAKSIYLIYKGLIKIYILDKDGKSIPIRIKGPPYLVGEMNLFDNESTANVEAIEETKTLVFSKDIFKKLIIQNSKFAFDLLKNINEKLRAANKNAEKFFSSSLKDRTLEILKTLAPHFQKNEVLLSQDELSLIIGASRARVTEILGELAKEKVITISHRKVKVI